MMKDILSGVKDVVVELGTGMAETCQTISEKASTIFSDIEVKLMGSYDDLEAYDNAQETKK